MGKLFFFDIDGTLIECSKDIISIPLTTRNALTQLQKQGDDVFLATGRCKCFILDGVMDYPFNGYVTCNGAHVEYKGETVYKSVISREAIEKTHQLCLERDMTYYFEGNDYIYVLDKYNPMHLEFKDNWGMKDIVVVDEFDFEEIQTYIGMIVVNSNSDIDYMQEVLSPYFEIQKHQAGNSFDLTLKGESKAKGIEQLVEILNQEMNKTVAFGDGRNDVEMLQRTGLGIAMGNAAIEAKEVANYITDDVDKDGIVSALSHFSFI